MSDEQTKATPAAVQGMDEASLLNAAAHFIGTVRMMDGFTNQAARIGNNTNSLLAQTEYPLSRMTQDYNTLNSLYRTNWIVQGIIDTVPEDMCKNWMTVVSQLAPDALAHLARVQRQTQLKAMLIKGLKWGRLYGGAAGLILIDSQQDMLHKPLDLNTILPNSFRGLYIMDRWSGIYPTGQLVTDINSQDFGLPEFYQVTGADQKKVAEVHHSRLVRFTGHLLPYWEQVAEMHWGASEIEVVYDEIVRRDNVAWNIAELTFKARLDVQQVEGLEQLYGAGGQQLLQRFWNKMQAQSTVRSNFGVQVIGKEDTFQTHQYTFAGLADVYNNIMMDVAGAARIPVTKLFGRSAAGLNATGEGDERNYISRIEQDQEADLRPALEKLLPIMAMSTWGEIPEDLDFAFNPVAAVTADQQSSIAQRKVAAVIQAFDAGGFDQATLMKELRQLSEETGLFSNITDEMIATGEGVMFTDLQSAGNPMQTEYDRILQEARGGGLVGM